MRIVPFTRGSAVGVTVGAPTLAVGAMVGAAAATVGAVVGGRGGVVGATLGAATGAAGGAVGALGIGVAAGLQAARKNVRATTRLNPRMHEIFLNMIFLLDQGLQNLTGFSKGQPLQKASWLINRSFPR
jgi:hypothetical protein